MREVIDEILIPKFMELKMKASGQWIDTLETRYDAPNRVATIRGQFYSYWLVNGRNGNTDQSPEGLRRWAVWAGNTFIKQWVQDKGLVADPIAVAYSIAKRGTTWKRRGGSDLLKVLTERSTIQFINKRIIAIVRPRIAAQMIADAQDAFRR